MPRHARHLSPYDSAHPIRLLRRRDCMRKTFQLRLALVFGSQVWLLGSNMEL
jgi:hypothetical protein